VGSIVQTSSRPESDRREHERYLTIFRVAKLTSGNEQSLCVARNLSSGGMMVEVLTVHVVGQNVRVSFSEGQHLDGHIVWQQGLTMGVRFASEIDIADVLAKPPVMRNGCTRHTLRMPVRKHAQLRVGSKTLPIEIVDISARGARIEVDGAFGDHDLVWVIISGLDPLSGTIKWRSDGHAGIEFSRAIPIVQLMKWLRQSVGLG
jgi:PilZ domain